MLTKGDNNRVDDRGLYAPGQLWLQREDILGRAKGTLRYLGMVTIILNDYPVLKYVLIGEPPQTAITELAAVNFFMSIFTMYRNNGYIRADEQRIIVEAVRVCLQYTVMHSCAFQYAKYEIIV